MLCAARRISTEKMFFIGNKKAPRLSNLKKAKAPMNPYRIKPVATMFPIIHGDVPSAQRWPQSLPLAVSRFVDARTIPVSEWTVHVWMKEILHGKKSPRGHGQC